MPAVPALPLELDSVPMTDALTSLTPSEVLLINGEALFTEKVDAMSFHLPRGRQVEAEPTAVLALQIALLAAEQAGTLRIDEGVKSRLFGLLKSREIRLRPGAATAAHPQGTLEARIHDVVRAAPAQGVTPRELLRGVIHEMNLIPASMLLHESAAALTTRGITEMKKIRVQIRDYEMEPTLPVLSAAGVEVAHHHAIGPITTLLERARAERPALVALLESELRKGIRARRASAGAAMPDLPDND